MRELSKYLENPFDDAGISVDELDAFTTDHLQRMTANNPNNAFTGNIAATTPVLAAFQTQFSGDLTKLGLRKASKQAKKDFRKTLPATMAKLCGAVIAKYGEKSPQMTECCPHGRNVFNTASDDALAGHLQTFVNGVTAHQADLGAQLVADATAVLNAWKAVYNASEGATGAKSASESAKKAARENLQLTLFKNLLRIAEIYPRQPEKLALWMQQSLLEDHPRQAATATPANPTPPSP